MKHIFIINPKAGVRNSFDTLKKEIEDIKNLDYVIYETKAHRDAIIFVKEYITEHPGEELRFYACGGDGTLFEVINGASGASNVEISCVPVGSGNDFLKYFGDPERFKDINNLVNGTVCDIDLLKFNDIYIANIFNIGFDSRVVVKQAKIKKWPLMSGKGAYNLSVFFSLFGKMSWKCKLLVDEEVVYDGKMTLAAIANGICYGGGYYCCPKAKVDDGLIDICLVKKVSILTFAKLVGKYKAGRHLDDEKVMKHLIYKQGKKIQLELSKVLPYSADGEIDYSNNVNIEIVNKCCKFVVPKV